MTIHKSFSRVLWLSSLLAFAWILAGQSASQSLGSFTVADEVGLALFGDPYTAITVAPNGEFAAVQTERGLIAENRVQDELRIYSLATLRSFANDAGHAGTAEPLMAIVKSTYKQGPIISAVRWLPDSAGLAFLIKTENGLDRLWLAKPQGRTLSALTPADQDVTSFDVHDATHFIYTVRSPGAKAEMMKAGKVPAFAGTGISPTTLMSLDEPLAFAFSDRSELWASRGGKPFLLRNPIDQKAVPIYTAGQTALSLAPDGNSVATALAVDSVPAEWETKYPPMGWSAFRVNAGRQDLEASSGGNYVSVYATIDLRDGKISVLTGAPTAVSAGWQTARSLDWSEDSRAVLLPGTFLGDRSGVPPCIAVAVPSAKSVECLQLLPDYHKEVVRSVQFALGRTDHVVVEYSLTNGTRVKRALIKMPRGVWETQQQTGGAGPGSSTLELSVKQGLNDPPVLIATDHSTQKSRVVWDANPQLKQIRLGEATVYHWKDKSGRDWTGGLYKPFDYTTGRRYPLVIQTHGFVETQFRPSGIFPTAFAARALAAAGIAVLQVRDCPIRLTPAEGACQVLGYQSAVQQLTADGLIDPDRVGIIGFSRTCFYVMEALTAGAMHFRAASITDGVNEGYLQYLLNVDGPQNAGLRESESMIGAVPSGAGLEQWFRRSPEFNLDKVTAPLQVVASRGRGVRFMWEPYAMLRVLKKPVDLIIINTNEHVLTNPGVRLASQGGSVDWFRFWLKGEEDPDPAKREQYARWRELRKLQESNTKAKENKPIEKQ